ncbi:MAG: CAP domain-containing protein [Acidimicrobiales bacterium]
MRLSRARTILTNWVAPAVLATVAVAACSSGDEAVVAADSWLADGAEGAAEAGARQQPADDLPLRSRPDRSPSDSTLPAAPPTLSPDAPPVTTAPPATAAPTTVPVAPAPEVAATPTSAPSQDGQPTAGDGSANAEATTPTSATSATSAATADGTQLDGGEIHSFTMLNDLRTGLGLPALVRDPEMDAFAREWSRQMAESQLFEHSEGPYGENIAFTSNTQLSAAEAAELFHELWVESPEHYTNMSDDRYASSGIGLYLTPNGWYGTHVFKF